MKNIWISFHLAWIINLFVIYSSPSYFPAFMVGTWTGLVVILDRLRPEK